MPIYSVTAPDGKTYKIEGPEGASQTDVEDEVLRQNPHLAEVTENTPAPTVVPPTAPNEPEQPSALDAAGRSLGLGVRDVITGAPALLDIAATPLNAGINAIAGTNLSETPFRDLGTYLPDKLGLPVAESDAEKLFSAFNEGGVQGLETVGIGLGLQGVKGAAGVIGKALAEYPLLEVLSGGTGLVASEAAAQQGAGAVGQIGAALAGGVVPFAAAGAARRAGQALSRESASPEQIVDYQKAIQDLVNEGASADDIRAYVGSQGADPDLITGVDQSIAWRDAERAAGRSGNVGVVIQKPADQPDVIGGIYRTRAEERAVDKARVDASVKTGVSPAEVTDDVLRAELGQKATLLDKQPPTPRAQRLANSKLDIEQRIGSITSGWKNAPAFEVITNVREISDPAVLQRAIAEGAEKDALGLLGEDGIVRIFAQNIKRPEDLSSVIYHEALGHYGLAQKFGDDLSYMLEQFYNNNVGSFKTKVDEWLDKYPTAYNNTDSRYLIAAEEVLAEMSQQGRIPVTIKDRVSNLIKDTGRQIGVDLKYSDREINTILGMAHDATIKGQPSAVANGFRFARLWHGTPKDEPIEAFDHSYIGTGEGNQTFGWGTYLTEVRDLADKFYRQRLLRPSVKYLDQDYNTSNPNDLIQVRSQITGDFIYSHPNTDLVDDDQAWGRVRRAVMAFLEDNKTAEPTPRYLAEKGSALSKKYLDEHPEVYDTGSIFDDLADYLETYVKKDSKTKGNLYEVEVPDDALWLDFDKPLSQQPKIAKLLFEARNSFNDDFLTLNVSDIPLSVGLTGKDVYKLIAQAAGSQKRASEFLNSLGITGNRYLSGLDRSKGSGKSNYVVFDDKTPRIVNRYMRADQVKGVPPQVAADLANIEALDNYKPVYRSWDSGKQALYDAGLSRAIARKFKTVGQLDQAVFKYDNLAQETQTKMNEAVLKYNSGNFTVNDKAEMLEAIATHQYILGKIFNLHSELGRGLSAVRAVEYSARDIARFDQVLRESGGTSIGALGDSEVFDKFMRQLQVVAMQNNPAGVTSLINSVMQPYWWQYILSYRHAAMLSGLATHAKNTMDNAIILSRDLGETWLSTPLNVATRGKLGASPQEAMARTYGIIRAALDSETYTNTMKAFKEGHGNQTFSSKIEMQDARIPVVSKVSDFLHAQDTFFRAFHTNAALYAIGVRQAIKEGFKGKAALEEGTHRAANPTLEMLQEAKGDADVALLVNTPPFLNMERMKAIRPGMNAWEQAGAFVTSFIFPFFRTSQNLIFQKLRRMGPLALLDKVTWDELKSGDPSRTGIAITRILYTSGLLAYYWASEEGEKVQGVAPPYKKLQALEAGGFMPNSVKEDDKYVDAYSLNLSLNPLDMHNQIAADVASLRKAYREGASADNVAVGLALAAKSLGGILSSASFADNIKTYTEPFEDDANDSTLANLGGSVASQFIPAFIRQYNYLYGDNIVRDTTGDKSISSRIEGRLKSQIPGLSQDLPARRTVYGDERERGRTLLGINNYQEIRQDEVSKELQALEKSTDSVVVKGAPSSFRYEGEPIKLNAEGKNEWQRIQGEYLRLGMSQAIPTPEWKNATTEERIQIVKEIQQEAYDLAKQEIVQLMGLDTNPLEEGDSE